MSIHYTDTIKEIEQIVKVKLSKEQKQEIDDLIIKLLQLKVNEITKAGYRK